MTSFTTGVYQWALRLPPRQAPVTFCPQLRGLTCITKPDSLFPPPCQNPAEGLNTSSMFHNISLNTVMSCKGRQKCSLHLRIKTVLQVTDHIHGVSICTETAGMMVNCRVFSFKKRSKERMSGLQVEVEDDCTDISPNQHVQVMVKTVPVYCGLTWSVTYNAPGCNRKDFRKHVPECITGKLSYTVNPERKELSVSVSDMLEDHNYLLRLCHKHFICVGTGAHKLIKKEEAVKSATFTYSRPLPCLCIEGWSAVMDAPRVQVCPFKDRLEELWYGVTFDPLEQMLSWLPPCQVSAVVTLCQKSKDSVCVDLPHASQNASREKIIFTRVDPHPQLCVKFTTDSQSWIRCPFAEGSFQAWEVVVTREEVKMLSHITATFSVGLCVKSAGSAVCQTTETHTVHVEKNKAVGLNFTGQICNSSLMVKRLDVNYAATVLHYLEQCNHSLPLRPLVKNRASWDFSWVIIQACVCLSGIITATLVLYALLTVDQRRKVQRNGDEKQIDPPLDFVVPALQAQPVNLGQILIPDSPQSGNAEKTNLICD
uniref:putative interleukin-17 receptor E-like isoform X2 n=1 Tax=Monopterus albus TaxID=43700 RepID=UPI0009B43290|nr:putative interleukin-17 receptor E-like isoform X2 [Monopterus albus]